MGGTRGAILWAKGTEPTFQDFVWQWDRTYFPRAQSLKILTLEIPVQVHQYTILQSPHSCPIVVRARGNNNKNNY